MLLKYRSTWIDLGSFERLPGGRFLWYGQAVEVIVTDKNDIEKALMLYLSNELDDKPELGCDHRQVAIGESPS